MSKSKQCLIVDDSGIIRKVTRLILEDLKFSVEEAEDATVALGRCDSNPPSLILVDWSMPGMSTFEFLSSLRLKQVKPRPFVIYCTTEYDTIDISRALQNGADDFMLKPFDRCALEAKFAEIRTVAGLA